MVFRSPCRAQLDDDHVSMPACERRERVESKIVFLKASAHHFMRDDHTGPATARGTPCNIIGLLLRRRNRGAESATRRIRLEGNGMSH